MAYRFDKKKKKSQLVSKCASLQGKTVEKVKWVRSVLFLNIFISAFKQKKKGGRKPTQEFY